MGNAGELFGPGSEKQQVQYEHKTGKLYEEIGRLKVEVDWLKKRPDIWVNDRGETSDDRANPFRIEHQTPVPAIEPQLFHLQ